MAAKMRRRTTTKSKKSTKSKKKPSMKLVKKKSSSVSKPYSKSQLIGSITESSGLHRKQVSCVFDCLEDIIGGHLAGRGPGSFTLPGLCKMMVIHKPATKARKGINPFTGEPTIFKAKPARRVVKIRALKKLKEMV